jgi:hypothetical protein
VSKREDKKAAKYELHKKEQQERNEDPRGVQPGKGSK